MIAVGRGTHGLVDIMGRRSIGVDRVLTGLGAAAVVVLIAAALLAGVLMSAGMPREMSVTAALIVFAVGYWAFGVLPDALTGLIFLVGAVILAGMPSTLVFSGFSTSAFWLIFAGLVLSACATHTGLAAWLGRALAARTGAAGGYGAVVSLVVAFSAALALILPSTFGRVALLVPLVAAMAGNFGYKSGGRGRAGLILAAAIGTYVIPTTFLPANLPNLVLAGSLESIHGVTPTFGAWLALHFPVIAIIKGGALVGVVVWLFAESPAGEPSDRVGGERRPLTGGALRLAAILAVTLALWATDTLHGQSAAWIGMTAAIVCLIPPARIMEFAKIPAASILPILIHLGAVLGLGVVMAQSGVGAALAKPFVEALPLADAPDAIRLAMLAAIGIVASLAATMPGAPAVTAPLFGDIAAITGWSVEAVGMSQVISYATPLLPYQLPPIVLAAAMGNVSLGDATRVMLVLAAVTTPLVLPAAFLWWRLLGWI
jgi:di/tricarboxylate transporter